MSACHCMCGVVHPSANICDPEHAMTTRPIVSRTFGPRDVPVCQPCAVAHDALGVLRERQQLEDGPAARHAGQPDYGGGAAVVVLALAALAVLAIGLALVLAS